VTVMNNKEAMAWDRFLGGYVLRLVTITEHFSPVYIQEPHIDFISELRGELLHNDGDDNFVEVGELHAWMIHHSECVNTGEDLYSVFDSHSQELTDVYNIVFDDDGELRSTVGEPGCPSFIIHISDLEVSKEHRGRGLGLCLLAKVMAMHSDSIITLQVPLKDEDDERSRDEGLECYYHQIGFCRLGAGWMAADTRVRVPSIQKVLGDKMRKATAPKLKPVVSKALQ
jgi:hypothetical protein